MGPFCILSSLLLCSALGDLVVNEVYYDHPGADSGYEFVEFYNPLPWPVSLDGVNQRR